MKRALVDRAREAERRLRDDAYEIEDLRVEYEAVSARLFHAWSRLYSEVSADLVRLSELERALERVAEK